jgi:hypothetical protein
VTEGQIILGVVLAFLAVCSAAAFGLLLWEDR